MDFVRTFFRWAREQPARGDGLGHVLVHPGRLLVPRDPDRGLPRLVLHRLHLRTDGRQGVPRNGALEKGHDRRPDRRGNRYVDGPDPKFTRGDGLGLGQGGRPPSLRDSSLQFPGLVSPDRSFRRRLGETPGDGREVGETGSHDPFRGDHPNPPLRDPVLHLGLAVRPRKSPILPGRRSDPAHPEGLVAGVNTNFNEGQLGR